MTENITYGCIDETDWSIQMAEEIYTNDFQCPGCDQTYNFTSMQKLQHQHVCKPVKKKEIEEKIDDDDRQRPSSSNQKLFDCNNCRRKMYLTNIEILKHKKNCKEIKKETNFN